MTPDIYGEYETDVERAQIAIEPTWFPAVENRGEGVFVQLRAEAVEAWPNREAVKQRLQALAIGHLRWSNERKIERGFPGGPYVLLHSLSHVLIQSLSMRRGYPASSLRERIYADGEAKRYGVLFYTGSPDAEGTLGGLVQQGRHLEDHLTDALRMSALCTNDPICAYHAPGRAWRADYSMARLATDARWWRKRAAKCEMTISTGRLLCRFSGCLTPHFSRRSHDT